MNYLINSGPSGEGILLMFLVWIVLPLLVSFILGFGTAKLHSKLKRGKQ